MSSLDGWVLRLTSIFTCLNPVTNTNRCTPRRYIFLFPSLFLIACARERRLLPHDRIENGRGLRRCLNTRARARLIKCQRRTFLTAQFTRKAEKKKKKRKHTRAVLELSFFFVLFRLEMIIIIPIVKRAGKLLLVLSSSFFSRILLALGVIEK